MLLLPHKSSLNATPMNNQLICHSFAHQMLCMLHALKFYTIWELCSCMASPTVLGLIHSITSSTCNLQLMQMNLLCYNNISVNMVLIKLLPLKHHQPKYYNLIC